MHNSIKQNEAVNYLIHLLVPVLFNITEYAFVEIDYDHQE